VVGHIERKKKEQEVRQEEQLKLPQQRDPSLQHLCKHTWPVKRFYKYAILGDDICITDSKVAEVYLSTLKDLGVTISLPKSLVSGVGGAEFAKKFRCKNCSVDFSPVYIRNLANSHTIHGVYSLRHLYKIQRFFHSMSIVWYWL